MWYNAYRPNNTRFTIQCEGSIVAVQFYALNVLPLWSLLRIHTYICPGRSIAHIGYNISTLVTSEQRTRAKEKDRSGNGRGCYVITTEFAVGIVIAETLWYTRKFVYAVSISSSIVLYGIHTKAPLTGYTEFRILLSTLRIVYGICNWLK